MFNFKNKKVAVLGAGVEGKASAHYLKKHGADVVLLDEKENPDAFSDLNSYDLVFRSPGVKLEDGEVSPEKLTSQTRLFFELCPCEIIGVTGTKGKGTTSSLIYEMLKKQGYDAYLGGNIGQPPFEFLDTLSPQSKVVLELSSFQLQDFVKTSNSSQSLVGKPHIAVLLMMTQEHLAPDKGLGKHENYHKDVYEYVDAKRNILRFQTASDFAVINRDYPASHESDIHTEGKVYQVSREREAAEDGCFVRENKVIVRKNGNEQEIIDVSEIKIPGKHNFENVCAAVMAASLSGVSVANIASVLQAFKGLEHRLELVGEVSGVKYYDDSISTTPETAIAAIQAFKQPEVLILGGARKGADFTELGNVIAKTDNIRAIIGVGVEWEKIKEQIEAHNKTIFMVEGAKNMEQIVQAASKIAQPGDIVLLSPACSSFDMFKNYKDRGEQFKEEVSHLIPNS